MATVGFCGRQPPGHDEERAAALGNTRRGQYRGEQSDPGDARVLAARASSPSRRATSAKARDAARKLGIPKAVGSYEELLADPEVDAIYNPLPNHLHVPWSIRAADAGKHVLCEKPIALQRAEARTLHRGSQPEWRHDR